MSAAVPVLEASNLVKTYGGRGGPMKALDDVSLALSRGETLCVVGESGSGKSTLAKLIMGLAEPTSGEVRLGGTVISGLSRRAMRRFRGRIQLIFQDPFSSFNPRHRLAKALDEPLRAFTTLSRVERRKRAETMMEQVALPASFLERYPFELSGGQRQRLAIARALISDPEVVIADEAVSALDVSIQAQVLNLIAEMKASRGFSLVFITHDLGVVDLIADRVAVLYLGALVEIGPRAAVLHAPAHPYTRALIDAVPRLSGVPANRVILSGDIKEAEVEQGCRFHPRCPLAQDLCRRSTPPLRTADSTGRLAACHFAGPVSA